MTEWQAYCIYNRVYDEKQYDIVYGQKRKIMPDLEPSHSHHTYHQGPEKAGREGDSYSWLVNKDLKKKKHIQ